MSRLLSSVAIIALLSAPALAADWSSDVMPDDGWRTGFGNEPRDWSGLGDTDDSVHIETGLRYWYSMGSQSFDLNAIPDPISMSTSDTAHTGEVFLKIDDDSSRTYAKAWGGYSAAINGTYDAFGSTGSTVDGEIGYAGADFGWNAFGDGNGSGIGGFVGYQYWNDSPRTLRDNYAVVTSASDVSYDDSTGVWSVGADGVERHLDINMLRLGISGKVKLGDMFDLSGELAAVPYATIGGQLGGGLSNGDFGPNPGCDTLPCDPYDFRTSPLTITGEGYGAMAELMAGIHPTENLTVRLGARAWYLQGSYDATYSAVSITPPIRQPDVPDTSTPDPDDMIPPDPLYSAPLVTGDDYISTNNPFSLLRYGLLAEITYNF